MFHPVGNQPPSTYWRRRLIMLGAVVLVIVLIALTVNAVTGSDNSGTGATAPTTSPAPAPVSTTAHTPSTSAPAPSTTAGAARTTGSAASANTAGTPVPPTCSAANLQVSAVVGKSAYKVGEMPLVELQVVNAGTAPCVQNLADSQIVLRVYNGTSRVWGSHDCAVQPGTDKRTLAVGQPYRIAVLWGGKSSQPGCSQTTRQQVGAGSYTLYASLGSEEGKAAQFSIT